MPLGLVSAERSAGLFKDFQCADDAAQIIWMQPGSADGIDLRQTLVHEYATVFSTLGLQPVAESEIDRRTFKKALEQRLEIKRRASDERAPACRALRFRGCKRPLAQATTQRWRTAKAQAHR